MSFCTNCKIELNSTNSYSKGKKGGLQSFCKSCFNKYTNQRRKKRKQELIEERGGICFDCKNSFHCSIFEFHHLEPNEKEFSWSKAKKLTEEKMRNEMNKCVMLCANCHRLRHWKDFE